MRVLEALPKAKRSSKGRAETYDYNKFFDGQVYELARGDDFTCKPVTMMRNIRSAAKRRGIRVSVVSVDADRFAVQALDAKEPQGTAATEPEAALV